MITCYIGLGGNLNKPLETIKSAVEALKALPDSEWVGVSPFYQSQPMGPADQPEYVNAVAAIRTQLPALTLLDHTQAIENTHGRVRKDNRWGPRTLDLDLLLYGDQRIENERLTVPHYGMKEREFVLYPLADLAPELVLPCGTALGMLLEKVPLNKMKRLIEGV